MKIETVPRILIAGTSSGCGKTTFTCGLLRALRQRGFSPASLKCGPDYIDPMFHASVLGVESANLDPFFCDDNLLRALLVKNAAGCDLAVIEGVMGYYDGTGQSGSENSTYSVAVRTDTPVVLVVNGKGASTSVLATLAGFANFRPGSNICGVVINQVTAGTYALLKKQILSYFGGRIVPVGYLPKLPADCVLESRHLGLVTAGEIDDLRAKIDRVAAVMADTVDFEALRTLAHRAAPVSFTPPQLPRFTPVRLAVAKDRAFCFYYKDNFSLLREMGAELLFFSPLANEPVPADADGLLLGGGYPELYDRVLSQNRVSAESVRAAVQNGMPAYAECGGFMYLGQAIGEAAMCGALSGESRNTGKLVRFGYITLTAKKPCVFGDSGISLRGHEFHYFDSTVNGADFEARKVNGTSYECGIASETLYAGFAHLYLYSNIAAASGFYQACLGYQNLKRR